MWWGVLRANSSPDLVHIHQQAQWGQTTSSFICISCVHILNLCSHKQLSRVKGCVWSSHTESSWPILLASVLCKCQIYIYDAWTDSICQMTRLWLRVWCLSWINRGRDTTSAATHRDTAGRSQRNHDGLWMKCLYSSSQRLLHSTSKRSCCCY